MNGDTSPRKSSTSHVGTGSSWHVLFGAEPMSLSISSAVTAVHSLSNGVVLYGTSYRGVATVDARTDATLSLKKDREVDDPTNSVKALKEGG